MIGPDFTSMTPHTKGILFQYLASTAVSIAVIMTGNAMGWPSPTHHILLSQNSPVPMNTDGTSWMISLMYLGNIFSPLPCGYLMERFGRKNTLLACNILPLTSWLLIIFTRTASMLFLARFLAGLWLGIVYTVVPIYLGEIAETKVRGSLSTFFAVMTYLGILFELVLGPYVSYNTLAIASAGFCILFYITFPFVPETPYYLIKIKNKEAARASLMWLRGGASSVDDELIAIETAVERQLKNKGTIKDLFATEANRKAVIIVGVLSILQRVSGIGAMIAYASTSLPKDSVENMTTDQCMIILGTAWLVSTIVSSLIVDHLNRRTLLIVSSLGCAISAFFAGLWFLADEIKNYDVHFINWVPFACFIIHALFYSIGLNPIVTTIKGEVFSVGIKGVASAITTLMLAFSSFLLNKSYQPVHDHVGLFANYWLYASGCIIAVIFTLTYVVETKGKTLQEIQDELSGGKSIKCVSRL